MWIEHIGTIAMLAFLVLLALKLGVMFWFKWQKHLKQKKDAE